MQLPAQLVEFLNRAKFRIDLRRIHHVIAMRAAGARLQYRGSVEIGDAEPLEIVKKQQRVHKPKVAVELNTIG
jgi:hypothetical protein